MAWSSDKIAGLMIATVVATILLGAGLAVMWPAASPDTAIGAAEVNNTERHARDRLATASVFASMVAGFPAVGLGAYLMYDGHQRRSRRSSSRSLVSAYLIMGAGLCVVMSGLALPLVVWWWSHLQ